MLKRPTHYRTTTRDTLSERQREVLALIAKGQTNAQIADQLGLSLDGAKFHVREILGKLNVESREEAAELWRADQSAGTKVASFLRAATSLSWLKSAAAVAAVGGVALGSTALTIALTQGGGDKSERADDGSTISAFTPEPTLDPALMPLDCEPADIEWRGETRRNDDGSVRLDIYVRQANLPAGETCMIRGDALLTPAMIDPAIPGAVTVFALPVTVSFEDEIAGSFQPMFVMSAVNVCADNAGVRIFLDWTQMGTGSTFDIETPECVNNSGVAEFHALWWRVVSSIIPRLTPVPTPTKFAVGPLPTTPVAFGPTQAAYIGAVSGFSASPGYLGSFPPGVSLESVEAGGPQSRARTLRVILRAAGQLLTMTVWETPDKESIDASTVVGTHPSGGKIYLLERPQYEELFLVLPSGVTWEAGSQVTSSLGRATSLALLEAVVIP